MAIKDPIMDILQANLAGGLVAWALILAFIALVAVLCVLLFYRGIPVRSGIYWGSSWASSGCIT